MSVELNVIQDKEEVYWEALQKKDVRYDGAFFYGVRSTGIYCRPSCPSRRPNREQVAFFDLPERAEQAGFRACLRCQPQSGAFQDPGIRAVAKVCSYVDENLEDSLTLAKLSAHCGLSAFHLQRTFKRIMGISPLQYVEARRLACLKRELRKGQDVTTSLYAAGYSSSSRLYERSADHLGMTPGTYRRGGAFVRIQYTVLNCVLGKLLIAATEKGICAVKLGDSKQMLETSLRDEFPNAKVSYSPANFVQWAGSLQNYLEGTRRELNLPLDVQATAFQQRVWEELRKIPYGQTRTYGEIAKSIGKPRSARAVANACATNKVALIVPCHRVVREDGKMGGYRWGVKRKEALLKKEKDPGSPLNI